MAILIKTNDPQQLLRDIKEAIDNNVIQTWSYDKDGDFTHTLEQWKYNGWMRPHTEIINNNFNMSFGFLGNTSVVTTKAIYAVYHGRFAEMLLAHFDEQISNILLTSMPKTEYDTITTRKDVEKE